MASTITRYYRKRKQFGESKREVGSYGGAAKRRYIMTPRAPLSLVSDKRFGFAFTGNATNSDVGTSLHCLNLVTTGTDNFNRVGAEIDAKWLRLDVAIQHTGASADMTGPAQWRFFVFWQSQSNGATAVLCNGASGLMSDAIAGAIVINRRNALTKRRYKLLRDKHGTLDVQGGSSNIGSSRSFKIFIRLKQRKCIYSASTGAASDIQTNSLWFGIISTQPASTNTSYLIGGNFVFNDA